MSFRTTIESFRVVVQTIGRYCFSFASARIVVAMSLLMVASARLCAAASASKLSPWTFSLARCAARKSFAGRGLAHRPHCFYQGRLAASGFEALDFDRDHIVWIEVRKPRSRHIGGTELGGEVAGDGACDAVVERRCPAIEFVDFDPVGGDLNDKLWLINRRGYRDRPDHDGRRSG